MKKAFPIIFLSVLFLVSCAGLQKSNIPEKVVSFRDNPYFYQTIRGLKHEISRTQLQNEEETINRFDTVYREYIRELFKGFKSELAGNIAEAKAHYLKTLATPVHDEQNYYSHLDLARVALKEKTFSEAKENLNLYLSAMEQEIRAGEGFYTEMFFGYAPESQDLEEMKAHYKTISAVYEQLKSAF